MILLLLSCIAVVCSFHSPVCSESAILVIIILMYEYCCLL